MGELAGARVRETVGRTPLERYAPLEEESLIGIQTRFDAATARESLNQGYPHEPATTADDPLEILIRNEELADSADDWSPRGFDSPAQ